MDYQFGILFLLIARTVSTTAEAQSTPPCHENDSSTHQDGEPSRGAYLTTETDGEQQSTTPSEPSTILFRSNGGTGMQWKGTEPAAGGEAYRFSIKNRFIDLPRLLKYLERTFAAKFNLTLTSEGRRAEEAGFKEIQEIISKAINEITQLLMEILFKKFPMAKLLVG